MSTGTIVIIVIVVLVLAALAVFALRPALRRRRLREKFGPEYDRTVETSDDRREAESELAQREQRHAKFDLHPLSASARENYTREWAGVQEEFVDAPTKAVTDADRLVTTIMAERGYPTEGYDQQVADLSVEHSATLGHYRDAHEIVERHSRDEASTEDLRNAMVHYRTLVEDLLRHGADHDGSADDRAVAGRAADDRAVDGSAANDRAVDGDRVDADTADVEADRAEPDTQRRV
jgi:hypothetical protein